LTISQITPSGTGFAFQWNHSSGHSGVAQSATFTVSFAPRSVGNTTGSLLIASNASNPTLTVALTGPGPERRPGSCGRTFETSTLQHHDWNNSESNRHSQRHECPGDCLPRWCERSSIFCKRDLIPRHDRRRKQCLVSGDVHTPGLRQFIPPMPRLPATRPTLRPRNRLTGSGTAPQHSVSLGWNTSTSSGRGGIPISIAQRSPQVPLRELMLGWMRPPTTRTARSKLV